MKHFDVIIIGAGISGLSAALTAVNKGLRVALIEKENYIGGIAQDCFHVFLCGLFKDDDSPPFQIANPGINSQGICSQVFDHLYDCYGEKCQVKLGKVQVLAFDQKDLWNYFKNQLKMENFTLFLETKCSQVIHKNHKIEAVQICTSQKKNTLIAKAFINTTGTPFSGHDSEMKNADFSDHDQLGGYCMMLKGQAHKDLARKDLSVIVPYTARKIVEKNKLDDYLRFVTITYNFLLNHHVLKFSVKHDKDIEKCEFIYQQLNENIKELSQLELIKTSGKIHSRSGKQNYSPETKTQNETQKEDADCVVQSFWPKEKWDIDKGTQYEYPQKGKPLCILVSALKDDRFDNLFLAGKSIQVHEDMHASTRVMGVCMATGEQASLNALKYLKKG